MKDLYSIPTKVLLSEAIYRVKFVLRLTQLTSVLTRLNICQHGKSLRLGSNLYTACCKRKNTGRCFTITEAICTPFKRFFERFVVSVISIRDFLNGIRGEVCNSPLFEMLTRTSGLFDQCLIPDSKYWLYCLISSRLFMDQEYGRK